MGGRSKSRRRKGERSPPREEGSDVDDDEGATGTLVPEEQDGDGVAAALRELREGQRAFQQSMEASVDTIRHEVEKEKQKMNSELQKVSQNMEKIWSGVKSRLDGFDAKFFDLDSRVDTLESMTTNQLSQLERQLHEIRGSATESAAYGADTTVIIVGLPFEEDEDLMYKARQLVHVKLALPGIEPIRAVRTPPRDGKPGLVKMQLPSVAEKVEVLKSKMKLREHQECRKVYIHGSRTHTERLLELNIRTLLRELPNGNLYRLTGSGRLVRRDGDDAIRQAHDSSQPGGGHSGDN